MRRREALGAIGVGAVAAMLGHTVGAANTAGAATVTRRLPPDASRAKFAKVQLFPMTPMRLRNGRTEVDFDGFAGNMRFYAGAPGDFGIAVIGAVGEYHVLTPDERREMMRVAAAEKGDRVLVAGAGGDTTRDAIANALAAQEAGADAAVMLPSAVIGEGGSATLLKHFLDIARAVDIGVIPYRSPYTLFDLDALGQLEEHPNIVAVKEQTGDVRFLRDAYVKTEGRLPIIPAHERLAPFNHLAGAAGMTSGHANMTLRRTTELWQWLNEGRVEEAMALADQFAELDQLRAQYGDVLLKAGLELHGLAGGPLRNNPAPLPADGRQALERALRNLGEL